eukprot:4213998-Pyramimonas_sp.AAC.1
MQIPQSSSRSAARARGQSCASVARATLPLEPWQPLESNYSGPSGRRLDPKHWFCHAAYYIWHMAP